MAKKILIVEDTADLLANLEDFLTMEGYNVISATNARRALQILNTESPDLIISDLMMHEMDGFSLVREIKKIPRLKNVPVAIFSAKPLQEYEDIAQSIGVNCCIKKPSTLEHILETIQKLLNE
jgi:DNA-binding response OmpR family regulator